ncbi:MAG: ribosomal protein S18-alanine N-acetyltransferase [Pseudomonadales bacterium]
MIDQHMLIRDLSVSDVPNVVELEQRVMPNPWNERQFKDSLLAGHYCSVLTQKAEIVAVAVFSQVVDQAELLSIAVDTSQHRKGLARRLLTRGLERQKEDGASFCVLEVMDSNIPAIHLYESMGFRRCGVRKSYYKLAAGAVDALVMRLDFPHKEYQE